MRHEMSLRGGIFNDAVDLFDTKLRDVLNTLLRQGLSEGSVTLKVNVELWNVGEQDENGIYHETNKTHFDYNVTSAITQKNKSNGRGQGDAQAALRGRSARTARSRREHAV